MAVVYVSCGSWCEKSFRLLWAACAVLLGTRSLRLSETHSPHLGLWEKSPRTGDDQHCKFWLHGIFYFNIYFSLPFHLFLSLSLLLRTSRMTTPGWSTMWMQTTASPWRVIFLRGPAMPSRRGIGLTDTVLLASLWIHWKFNFMIRNNSRGLITDLGGQVLSSKCRIEILKVLHNVIHQQVLFFLYQSQNIIRVSCM